MDSEMLLDCGLQNTNGVARTHVHGDGAAGESLDENLHPPAIEERALSLALLDIIPRDRPSIPLGQGLCSFFDGNALRSLNNAAGLLVSGRMTKADELALKLSFGKRACCSPSLDTATG